MKTTRREFLGTAATAAGAMSLGVHHDLLAAAEPVERAPESLSILILGGTAFTGPFQIKYALERGHKVTIFNRGKTQPTMNPEVFDRVEKLVGDRDDDLEALMGRKWDAVIDNSATRPRWVRQSTEILKGNCDTYLFTSSLSVHADFSKIGITEDDPVATIDDPTIEEITGETYGALKALSEDVVRDAFPDGAIILRPHLIVGPGDPTDRWTYWPVRIDRGGEVMAPGTPGDATQYIDTRDLAEFGVTLVENRSLGTYSGVGPFSPLDMGGLLYGIRAVVSNEISFTWVPADFLAEHEVAPWAHMPAWIPPEGEFAGFGSFDNSRSVAAGLKYRPLADTAMATLDWWKAQPAERTAEPRAGISPEREAEVLAAWHAREEGNGQA